MKNNLLILFTIFLFTKSYAQYFPYKAPSKNTAWIDSMNRIVKKVFTLDVNEKNNWKKQLNYAKTASLLGRYYEWAYNERYVKSLEKSLFFYNKIIDFPTISFDAQYLPAQAIKLSVYRKLADFYYKGKGVKKNKILSLHYALEGIGTNKDFYSFYSLRYFKTTNIILNPSNLIRNITDSIYHFKTNPFASKLQLLNSRNVYSKLKIIENKFANAFLENKVFVEINGNCFASLRSQAHTNNLLKNIQKWFLNNTSLTSENISYNVEVSDISDQITIKILPK